VNINEILWRCKQERFSSVYRVRSFPVDSKGLFQYTYSL
jgi:hypothetical protein